MHALAAALVVLATSYNAYGTVPRISNISNIQFDALVRAGTPFIIADYARNWGDKLMGWGCARFAREFPWARMRPEYSSSERPVKISSTRWRAKHRRICEDMRPPEAALAKLRRAGIDAPPRRAPYIWHTKNHARDARALVPLLTRPYFLHPDDSTQDAADWARMKATPEFWFGLEGAGAMAHVDGYCSPVVSVQLVGTKRWRLARMPARDSVLSRFDEFDAGIYRAGKWVPDAEMLVYPGEALVFPPGVFHETLVTSDGCSSSLSYQLARFPTALIRDRLPRFMLSSEMAGKCGDAWATFITLQRPGALRARPFEATSDNEACSAEAAMLLASACRGMACDRDALEHHFASLGMSRVFAASAVVFHDRDHDGRVSEKELAESLKLWHAAVGRLTAFLRAVAEHRDATPPRRRLEDLVERLRAVDRRFAALLGSSDDDAGAPMNETAVAAGDDDNAVAFASSDASKTQQKQKQQQQQPWVHFEGIRSSPDWETEDEEDQGYFRFLLTPGEDEDGGEKERAWLLGLLR